MTSTDDNTRWLLTVSRINSSGGLAEKWTFTGAMIEKIEFGSNYDYNSDGFSLIKMTWGITDAHYEVEITNKTKKEMIKIIKKAGAPDHGGPLGPNQVTDSSGRPVNSTDPRPF
jgi:hypothetical protein